MNHRSFALSLLTMLLTPCCALAQETPDAYPSKPVRIIVGTAPGGTDQQARMYATRLSETLGKPFIVENQPGKHVAWTLVAKAPADGYTLLVVLPDLMFAPALTKDLRIDPVRDFAAISLMSKAPYLLVVNPAVPAKSVPEFIKLAKAHPGKLNLGGGLPGIGTHLMAMWFIQHADIKATYVPYKGTALSVIDVIAGRIDGMFSSGITTIPHVRTGKLRALGTTAAQRTKELPDIPTFVEQGMRGFEAGTFHGWAAPAGTPRAIVGRLSVELARIAKLPEITEKLRGDNAIAIGSTPEQFSQFIAGEVQRWRKLVQDMHITATE